MLKLLSIRFKEQGYRSILMLLIALFFSTKGIQAQSSLNDGVDRLSQGFVTSIQKSESHRVAVIPFRWTDGRHTSLEGYLVQALTTRLSDARIPLVERTDLLEEAFRELKLSNSSYINKEQAQKLGRMLQASLLVTGALTELEYGYIEVNGRLIETETGAVLQSPSTRVVIDGSVKKLIQSLGERSDVSPDPHGDPGSEDLSARRPISGEFADVVFQLQACKSSGGTLSCRFLVTNKKSLLQRLRFPGYTTAHDNLGHEFYIGAIRIGGEDVNSRDFAPGVATPVELFFGSVPPESKSLEILGIVFNIVGTSLTGRIELRKIPISSN